MSVQDTKTGLPSPNRIAAEAAFRAYCADDITALSYSRRGHDSPFYRVIDTLTGAGFSRGAGEPLNHSVRRIDHPELLPMVRQHHRLRFGTGYASDDIAQLDRDVERWLADHPLQTD